jgi:histidinol-phosphatase (PHP family)
MQSITRETAVSVPQRVSVHGGHSGQFCHHAKDSLDAVVNAYIDAGFAWVGITEHMPPAIDAWRYPDEAASQLSTATLQARFRAYFAECRRLRDQYRDRIELFCGFETETYPGSAAVVRELLVATQPDYIVGSVHHVGGVGIDYNREHYAEAVAQAGGIAQLYCAYFDAQYAMLVELEPAVVGHFDLIRIFDPDYLATLRHPEVWQRIERNLDFVVRKELILDFNMRGFDKAAEQYPSRPVLEAALARGAFIVPGDDSHGVSSVARNYDRGIALLAELGHDCRWRKPRRYRW